ncbi:hypothetical protein CPLU01_07572 [Colletotrichum plurivorum]|uniref:Uncharacterized protein n=1 Tax=Colletotrichum plurivorum TaxID=2175906 RepID=A0A8H6KG11_9PEZI|nr:hypothetical protein CPLU01_07572 [Colletotrichum plurivorum]
MMGNGSKCAASNDRASNRSCLGLRREEPLNRVGLNRKSDKRSSRGRGLEAATPGRGQPGFEGTDSRAGPTTRERMETMPGPVQREGSQSASNDKGRKGGLGSGGGSHAHRTSGQARDRARRRAASGNVAELLAGTA